MRDDPAQALTSTMWVASLRSIQAQAQNAAVEELADFCACILERCGPTEELATFLDQRALQALEHAA